MDRKSYDIGYSEGYEKGSAEYRSKGEINNMIDRAYNAAVRRGKVKFCKNYAKGKSMLVVKQQIAAIRSELEELYRAMQRPDISDHTPYLFNTQEEAIDVLIASLTLCKLLGIDKEHIEVKMGFNERRTD